MNTFNLLFNELEKYIFIDEIVSSCFINAIIRLYRKLNFIYEDKYIFTLSQLIYLRTLNKIEKSKKKQIRNKILELLKETKKCVFASVEIKGWKI